MTRDWIPIARRWGARAALIGLLGFAFQRCATEFGNWGIVGFFVLLDVVILLIAVRIFQFRRLSQSEVNELFEVPSEPVLRLVTVASFSNSLDAHFARMRVDAVGIRCFLKNEQTVSLTPYMARDIGGVQLQVVEADYARAKQALEENPVPSSSNRIEA